MKFCSVLILLISLFALSVSNVHGQDGSSAAQRVEELRAQLLEVQAKEAGLQARLKQLEEDLKPENIERSLAGVGSTRPEELREQRRNQLSREKAGVLAQLEILAQSRSRFEAALANAEAAAYHQSARGSGTPVEQVLMQQNAANPSWLVGTVAGFIGILVLGLLFLVIRRARKI